MLVVFVHAQLSGSRLVLFTMDGSERCRAAMRRVELWKTTLWIGSILKQLYALCTFTYALLFSTLWIMSVWFFTAIIITVKLYKMSPKHALRLSSLAIEDWTPSSWKKKYFWKVWKQNFISKKKKTAERSRPPEIIFFRIIVLFSCYRGHIISSNGYFVIWINSNVLSSNCKICDVIIDVTQP